MVYFLSDAHLGSRAIADGKKHTQTVINLLLQMQQDATEIYLLGDIFDFWFEFYLGKPQGYDDVLDTLKQLTDYGIKIHYLIGNHDIWTFGWLAQRTGVIVYKKPIETIIQGKHCYLAHGDGLVAKDTLQSYPKHIRRKIHHFMLLRQLFHSPSAQFLYRLLPPAFGNKFGYEWAKKSRLKELNNPCPYKGEKNEELVGFAKEKEQTQHFDYYIFGHRHIELDLELATHSRVIILGDMFKQWTYAQMDEKGELQLLNYEQS